MGAGFFFFADFLSVVGVAADVASLAPGEASSSTACGMTAAEVVVGASLAAEGGVLGGDVRDDVTTAAAPAGGGVHGPEICLP